MARFPAFTDMEHDGQLHNRVSIVNVAKFTLIFLVFNLHQLLKSFAPIYGLMLLAAISVLGLDLLKARLRIDREGATGLLLVGAYFLAALVSYVHSLMVISPIGATIGLSRFLFAFPVFLASLIYIQTMSDLRVMLVSITVVVSILYLSIPWQIAFGQLSWLPSDYERGGFERYASLLGNVTAVGIAVGFYLAPALFLVRSLNIRIIIVVSLLLSSAASLSKAAIMNVALVPIIGIVQGFLPSFRVWQTWKYSDLIKVALVFFLSIIAAFSISSVRDRLLVNLASYGIESAAKADDVSINRSIWERIFEHPKEVLVSLEKRYDEYGWLTGAGYGMSSTALVPESDSLSIMAHNQFVDFIGIGGIIYLTIFLLILSYIGIGIYRLNNYIYRHNSGDLILSSTLMIIFIIFIINLPFANGLVYQPLQASIFWILLSVCCNISLKAEASLA